METNRRGFGKSALATMFAAGCSSSIAASDNRTSKEVLRPILVCKATDFDQLNPMVVELKRKHNLGSLAKIDINPGCCTWLEILVSEDLDSKGWIALHRMGGSVVFGTDAEQISIALELLIQASQKRPDGLLELAVGLYTSFETHKIRTQG